MSRRKRRAPGRDGKQNSGAQNSGPRSSGADDAPPYPPMAISIDVEDWFQVENLKGAISRDRWDEYPLRVEDNTRRILDIFDQTETTGTFFCLGWVAERRPRLIAEIARRGHEVASHGYGHELLYEIGPDRFRADIRRARGLLEDAAGTPVVGYRAPSFSITDWAIEILAEEGYAYDSSYFPSAGHDRYAKLPPELFGDTDGSDEAPDGATRTNAERSASERIAPPYRTRLGDLTELSIPVLELFGKAIPWGGGGYFRLYPPKLFRAGLAAAAGQHGGAVFYLHPWEVDPGQPRVSGIRRSYAFRHYVNLHKSAHRLKKLCEAFSFGSCISTV